MSDKKKTENEDPVQIRLHAGWNNHDLNRGFCMAIKKIDILINVKNRGKLVSLFYCDSDSYRQRDNVSETIQILITTLALQSFFTIDN